MESLLTPDKGLMIWTLVTFGVLLLVLSKVAWKPLLKALEEREAGIRSATEGAQRAQQTAEQLKVQYEKALAQGQDKADALLKQAQADAQKIREQMLKDAEAESRRLTEQTRRQLEEEKAKLSRELRQEVSALSIKVAEKLLRHSVDAKEQDALMAEFFKDLDNSSPEDQLMQDSGAARKYAKSLFAVAQEKKQLLACQQGLQEIARIFKLRRSLKEVLTHPFIAPAEKQKVIHSVLGEYATPLLEEFLSLIVRKRRVDLLLLIEQEFQQEVDRFQNVQPLRVKTAFAMSEAQQKKLKERLEKWLGSKVRMDVQVDPALIGGLIIQTRDQILDQSLKGQLKKLQQQLTA